MKNTILNIPDRIETKRLYLRAYQAMDAPWYYLMSQKNKTHLAQYESDNPVLSINSEEDAESALRGFTETWMDHKAFFMGVFLKDTQTFVAQIYIGVVNWNLPEFEIGYFVEKDHQGNGFVTEAVKSVLQFCFEILGAHRVRLECDDTNKRSYRVAERCDMIKEAHIRENKDNADGSISGTFIYGLLRSEYKSQKT